MVPDTLVGAETGPSAVHRDALEEAIGAATGVQPHTDYQDRPLEWIVEHLGVRRETLVWSENEGYEGREWDGDRDPFVQALQALADWKNVGIESATGTGKTYTLACITFWFLAVWEDSIVVTAAPKEDQLLDKVWKEIEALWPRFEQHFPDARLMDSGEIRMRPGTSRKWKAKAEVVGVSAGETSATKAQGEHAEHMLIITEETPGIHPAIMTAFDNTRTAPHNLQISVGNPDFKEDPLHQFCTEPGVRHIRVSAYDHPNIVAEDHTIVPGAVSLPDLKRRERKYEHTPSFRKSRLRGMSPKQAVGVVLDRYDESQNAQAWTDGDVAEGIREGLYTPYGGIDFGSWRFAFVLGLSDRAGRMHVVDEYFSQRETLEERAREIDSMLSAYGVDDDVLIWGDSANQQDIIEINRAFNRIGSEYRVREVGHKDRETSVTRLNNLLGHQNLLLRRDLGDGMEWRKGQDTQSDGEPMYGSRLKWEMRHWRYPEPREGQAQRQDPDDDTADGADAIAALRYMVMSWWRASEYEQPEPKRHPDRDYGLEETLENLNRIQRRLRRRGY